MRQLIFVVESDTGTRTMVCRSLEQAGYSVRTFASARGIEEIEDRLPSLMLIASTLPDSDTFDLHRRIRESYRLARVPMVSLLSGGTEEDRILALESGADDCISKPFSQRELVARVQAVLRRATRPMPQSMPEQADIVIDSSAMKLSVRGQEVPATSLEFRFVDYLARHRGQVFTRDLLLDAVWGDMEFVTPRNVDACVRRIREKIEPDRGAPTYLKTIRGVGYRFDAVASWDPTSNQSCTCVACTSARGNALPLGGGVGRRSKSSSSHR
jgi:DNA-binding response OmpR family regulator